MTVAWIGIGSNVGERAAFCRQAVQAIAALPGVEVTATSSLYETAPIGGPPQRSYLNAVAKLETELGPAELLMVLKELEQRLGRGESNIRWGPRVIDLDLLLYGDEKISEPDLEVPHPRMAQRRFVLVPLLEVDPDITDPWGARYADLLDEAEGDVELSEPF